MIKLLAYVDFIPFVKPVNLTLEKPRGCFNFELLHNGVRTGSEPLYFDISIKNASRIKVVNNETVYVQVFIVQEDARIGIRDVDSKICG